MPKITLKRVTNADGTVAELYPTTTLDQIISEGTGAGGANESLSSYIDARFILESTKGAASGVATLDSNSKITYSQIPDAIFGGLKFAGTITDNGDYGDLHDVIVGSTAANTITVSDFLDNIADVGQNTYDTQSGLENYETVKNKWIGYYWVVAGTVPVIMEANENNDASAYYGAAAFEDGVAVSENGAAQLDPGDWLVISGWDETLNSNNGGFIFSVINNTYTNASTSSKGIVQISTAADRSDLTNGSFDVITEDNLVDLILADNSDLSGTTNGDYIAPAAHHHDGIYYTESEIGEFFDGSTSITGYNKSNWDTAYGWGDHASGGYQSATNSQSVTLSGAVTGTGTITNFGDLSISTTATSDPTLTLDGDATGSATFTNLGNATLTVAVANDSHTHDGRYYTETEFNNWLDGTAIDSHNFTEIKYGADLETSLPSSGNIVGTLLIETD